MNSDLTRRAAFTLGALLVYRIGANIPLPGIDLSVWAGLLRSHGGLLASMTGPASGFARLGIFGLSLSPLFSAAILFQIFLFMSPRFRRFTRSGERERTAVLRYTLILALVLAVLQGYGVASGLERVNDLVYEPGPMFRLMTVLTLAGGTAFLIWLCHQITLRGLGNGIAWIVFLSIVMALPSAVFGLVDLVDTGRLSVGALSAMVLLSIVAVGFVAFVERARRRVPIEFSAREIGGRAFAPRRSELSVRLNSAGLVPAVVASWLLSLLTIGVLFAGQGSAWADGLAAALVPGRFGFLVYIIAGVVIVAYVYTAFIMDPDEAAASLERHGGSVAGLAPGEATAAQIDYVLSRMTVVGAIYLTMVFLLPVVLISYAHLPFYVGGAPLLILVCVVLDIEAQVRGKNKMTLGSLRA